MKQKKAISWEKLSEGVLTANEIELLQNKKQSISLNLQKVDPITGAVTPNIADIQIVPVKGPTYNVINRLGGPPGTRINTKPYKYLSCAVRRAVKEYKAALRSYKWKLLVK
jgi:hypothetical protein